MIGHVQTNKSNYKPIRESLIHGVTVLNYESQQTSFKNDRVIDCYKCILLRREHLVLMMMNFHSGFVNFRNAKHTDYRINGDGNIYR
jgi:hypothetical protein